MVKTILTKKRIFLTLGIFALMLLLLASFAFSFIFFWKGKGKVNLLVLGESGVGHEGGTLTDTIIFTSVSQEGTVLLSIPRDIWYQPLETKINSLYSRGGFEKEEKVMEEILGQRIDGSILVDFDLFSKIVDLIEGVDVYVEGTFDDFKYPIPGKEEDQCGDDQTFACRYEHVHFDAGWQYINGETALKYVRSRHAVGDEGTDYARSRRQQNVFIAIKNKILSGWLISRPKIIFSLFGLLRQNLKTTLKGEDLVSLGKILIHPSSRKMNTFVLDGWETSEGYLYHPKVHSSGQWVLLPQGGDWEQVHQFVASIL